MPGGMPYHLEKGPYLSVLEAQFNSDTEKLRTQANLLINGQPQYDTAFYDCPAIDQFPKAPPSGARAALRDHIYNHWFGWMGSAPNYTPQVLATNCSLPASYPQQTGYWRGYHGDVEKIVRTTLVRAAEVALGVEHETPPQIQHSDVRRHWPVEFFWVCGTDRFEGYVTWRSVLRKRRGQVTVVFVTPATPDPLFNDLTTQDPYPGTTEVSDTAPRRGNPFFISRPRKNDAMQGIWVVTHTMHQRHAAVLPEPTSSQQVLIPERAASRRCLVGGELVVDGRLWRGAHIRAQVRRRRRRTLRSHLLRRSSDVRPCME